MQAVHCGDDINCTYEFIKPDHEHTTEEIPMVRHGVRMDIQRAYLKNAATKWTIFTLSSLSWKLATKSSPNAEPQPARYDLL